MTVSPRKPRMTRKRLLTALVKLGACSDALTYVKESPYLTARQIWDHCDRGDWLRWICIRVIPAEYEKTSRAALTKAEKIRQTAWAEYNRVEQPAWAEYEKIRQPAGAEYDRVEQPAQAEYEKIRQTAWAEYDRIRQAAWATAIRKRIDFSLIESGLNQKAKAA